MTTSSSSESTLQSLEQQKSSTSYGTIMKSTSIIGGSRAIEYVISAVKIKAVALLLGPSGVGMIGAFMASNSLIGTITGLGIGSAGVREIARAHGSGDTKAVARSVCVLRRMSWLTGLVGWIVCITFSGLLSEWSFGSPNQSSLIAIVGVSLLFSALAAGESAIIQGTRRIGDIARKSVFSAAVGTAASLVIYSVLGERGIVPAICVGAAINFCFSRIYSHRIAISKQDPISWTSTLVDAKRLAVLGTAMMWGALLGSISDLAIRGMIVRDFGLEGGGMYSAAWALSGMFAGLVLGAMGTDFYPHLTSVCNDHNKMTQIMNAQIEIGVMIAMPGLIATLFFGPILIRLFYSATFEQAAYLLPWLVMAVFCRVVSFPLGYAILAKGASKWFFLTQTVFYCVQLTLVYFLLGHFGLVGVGVAIFITYLPIGLLNIIITRHLMGFGWSRSVFKLVLIGVLTTTASFLLAMFLSPVWSMAIGGLATLFCLRQNLRGVCRRLGPSNRICKFLARVPGGKFVLADVKFDAESKGIHDV